MINRVRDRSAHSDQGQFTDAFSANRTHQIGLADEEDIDIRDIGIYSYEVVAERCINQTTAGINNSIFQQRHTNASGDTADDLTPGRLLIENSSSVDCRNHSRDANSTQIRIHVDFDKLSGKRTGGRYGFV